MHVCMYVRMHVCLSITVCPIALDIYLLKAKTKLHICSYAPCILKWPYIPHQTILPCMRHGRMTVFQCPLDSKKSKLPSDPANSQFPKPSTAAKLWNAINTDTRGKCSLNAFKTAYKTINYFLSLTFVV